MPAFFIGFLVSSPVAKSFSSFELLPEEKQLLDYFAQRCSAEQKYDLSGHYGFDHPVDYISCEVTRIFAPERFNKRAGLRAFYGKSWGTGPFDGDREIYEAILDEFILENFAPDLLAGIDDDMLMGSKMALAGNANSLIHLLDMIANQETNLPNRNALIPALTETYSKPVIDILFGATSLTTDEIFFTALRDVVRDAHKTSPFLLNQIAFKVHERIASQGNLLDIFDYILKQDWTARITLLSFFSLIDTGEPTSGLSYTKYLLQALIWPSTVMNTQETFDYKPVTDGRTENEAWIFIRYFSLMSQINDLQYQIPPGYLAEKLLELNVMREEKILHRYDRYFPFAARLLNDPALKSISYPAQDWLVEAVKAYPNDELLSFLFNWQLVNIDGNHDVASESEMALLARHETRINNFVSELNLPARISIEGTKIFWDTDQGLPRQVAKMERIFLAELPNLKTLCNFTENQGCFKQWIGLSSTPIQYATPLPEVIVCEKIKNQELYSTLAQNLFFVQTLRNNCPAETLWSLGGFKNESEFYNNFWMTYGLPGPIGGASWLSTPLVFANGGGLLGIHLLKRSDKEIIDLPMGAPYLLSGLDRFGFSLASEISRLSIPPYQRDKKSSQLPYTRFGAYAMLQSSAGNTERAMVSLIKQFNDENLENELDYKPIGLMADLVFLSQDFGIPDTVINEYIDQLPISELPEFDYSDIPRHWEKQIYEGYLNPLKPREVLELVVSDKSSISEKALAFGSAMRLNRGTQSQLCKIEAFRDKFLAPKGSDPEFDEILTFFPLTIFYYFEQANFDSTCRMQRFFSDAGDNPIAEYQSILKESFIPFITANMNFADSRYFDSIDAFANMSGFAKRPFGIFMNLLILNEIYENYARSFVNVNSDSLRLAQQSVEQILTQLYISLHMLKGELNLEVERESKLLNHLVTLHHTLWLSFHNPLPSDKTRDRMLIETRNYDSQKKLYDAFDTQKERAQKQLATASDIVEYIEAKSEFGGLSLDIMHSPHFAARLMRRNIGSPMPNDKAAYVNFIHAGGNLGVLGLTSNGTFFSDWTRIEALYEIRDQVAANKTLTDDDLERLCAAVESLSDSLEVLNADIVFVTPSVNLFPLPQSALLGQGCKKNYPATIMVNDFFTAFEASHLLKKYAAPNHYFAAGNPIIRSTDFDSLLASIEDNQLRSTNNLNLENLPPLPNATAEVVDLSEQFDYSLVLTEENASIDAIISQAEKNKAPVVLSLATHGVAVNFGESIPLPGLLTANNGEVGLFSSLDTYKYKLEDSTVLLSACDTAAGFAERSDLMFTGFNRSFSDAGAKLIFSSLWPVKSNSSRTFHTNLIRSWQQKDIYDGIKQAHNSIDPADSAPFTAVYP